jgi:hypothetical protein
VRAHASALLAVPVGGDNWGSTATLLLCLTAAMVLVRQSRYRLLVLCAAPFALNLLAAALGRYPYGGHMRLTMHLVPIVSILTGFGGAVLCERLARGKSHGSVRETPGLRRGETPSSDVRCANTLPWPFTVAIGFLLVLAIAATVRDFFLPGKNPQDIRNRDFAAWFWSSMEREHEVLCTDEKLPPELPSLSEAGRGHTMPQFRCNQQIYSPRHVEGKPCDLSRVSAKRPMVCVQYWSHLRPYDAAAFAHWLDGMRQRYELVSTAQLPLLQDRDNDREPEPADRVEVYEFVPRR